MMEYVVLHIMPLKLAPAVIKHTRIHPAVCACVCVCSTCYKHTPPLVHWWPRCCSQTAVSQRLLSPHSRAGKQSPSSWAVERKKTDMWIWNIKTMSRWTSCTIEASVCVVDMVGSWLHKALVVHCDTGHYTQWASLHLPSLSVFNALH